MPRRALLFFADHVGLDLARRRLPKVTLALLPGRALERSPWRDVDVHFFGTRPSRSGSAERFHPQRGRDFAERLENAIETLAALGYEEIVAIGRDCPALRTADIAQAFDHLQSHALVLGPDHRGGCYLIAFRAEDRALLRGIRWRQNMDCAQLSARAGAARVALLPVKHDIDSWADLRLAARTQNSIARLLAFLSRGFSRPLDESTRLLNEAARFIRLHGQIPPPLAQA